MSTVMEFIKEHFPTVQSRKVTKLEGQCSDGNVTIYWAGAVLRIDVQAIGD